MGRVLQLHYQHTIRLFHGLSGTAQLRPLLFNRLLPESFIGRGSGRRASFPLSHFWARVTDIWAGDHGNLTAGKTCTGAEERKNPFAMNLLLPKTLSNGSMPRALRRGVLLFSEE